MSQTGNYIQKQPTSADEKKVLMKLIATQRESIELLKRINENKDKLMKLANNDIAVDWGIIGGGAGFVVGLAIGIAFGIYI